jgi:uncharacterized protein YndB with AHSA1/START domain
VTSDARVVAYERVVAAPPDQVFALIADPAAQPRWDGNDNLAVAAAGQRVRAVGDVFVMRLTRGEDRENHVVEFAEGRRIAWRPSEPGQPPPGHLWRWELQPLDDGRTLVRHTYDWSELTDPQRLERARATTADRLRASVDRLADLAEPITRPRAVAYVVRDGAVLVFTHRPTGGTEGAGLQVPGGTVHDGEARPPRWCGRCGRRPGWRSRSCGRSARSRARGGSCTTSTWPRWATCRRPGTTTR